MSGSTSEAPHARGPDDDVPPGVRPGRAVTVARAPRPSGRALTFGVLVDRLEDEELRVGGLVEGARASGVDLVCFVGAGLHEPGRFGEQRNAVYDLARSRGIDALVVLASLGDTLGLDDLARFCERYRPLPISSIAAAVEGMTSILIDGEPALRDGIRHLVEDHHYRQIAFLGGPESNREARVRLRTYRDVLTGYGLPPPDSFVATGDFKYESGVDAVRVLLDERETTFDALVVANDQMALGVIDALRARDIRVPRDIAIIGFDDIREGRYSAPPLTTIRQPLQEQGRLAVEVLIRRLRGEHVDDVLMLPAELVIRRSCGCFADVRSLDTAPDPAPSFAGGAGVDVEDALRSRRSRILEQMREPVSGLVDGFADGWDAALLDALIAQMHGAPHGFAECLGTLLADTMRSGATPSAWQPALSALRRELMPCLAASSTMRSRAEDLLQEARVLIGDAVEHAQAQHRLAIEVRTRALSEAAETMSAAFDLESLGDALRECLPRLGIPSGYLVLDGAVAAMGGRLAFAHDQQRDAAVLDRFRGVTFAGTFVPRGLLPVDRTYALIVEPLFFKDDPFGYAIFEMGPLEGLTYEALREQISGALKVAQLIAEVQVRAGQLQEAYGVLQDNQQRLLSAEKMATLGRVTANIAHEINTPLAAVRAALMEIDLRTREYDASIGDAEVTPEDHRQIAAEMLAAIQLARSAAERAAGFVRGIKTQTRDLAPQEKVRFDPVPVIEEALLLLSYDIRRASGGVHFEPPEGAIELLGTPGRLAQIVTNLVSNALDALADGGNGSVVLTLTADDDAVCLIVQDTGSGIPVELHEKVFEPMFTTKPIGQGTGLGLSIVKDLVSGYFGGAVELASSPGKGTTFTLTFPTTGTV